MTGPVATGSAPPSIPNPPLLNGYCATSGHWTAGAVGVIGGRPKLSRSWIGLDLAVSVASGAPALERFPVDATGPALVYPARDAVPVG